MSLDDDVVAEVKKVAGGCKFTEGPAADGEGNLLFSDGPDNRIMLLRPNGDLEVWREPSGRANGMNFDSEGRLVTRCAQGEGGERAVRRYEPDGSVTVLASRYEGKKLNSPNDLCFDAEGRIYFTDPRYGDPDGVEQELMGVYRIEKDGSLIQVIDDAQVPNGILMSPDGRNLYLVDNNPKAGGNRTLLVYALVEGSWVHKGEIYDFSPGRGADGMVLDADGNIYVTAGSDDQAGVYVFTPEGEQVIFLPTPENPTNCTFGGPELMTLYITAMTSVYSIECRVPGHLAFPKV